MFFKKLDGKSSSFTELNYKTANAKFIKENKNQGALTEETPRATTHAQLNLVCTRQKLTLEPKSFQHGSSSNIAHVPHPHRSGPCPSLEPGVGRHLPT